MSESRWCLSASVSWNEFNVTGCFDGDIGFIFWCSCLKVRRLVCRGYDWIPGLKSHKPKRFWVESRPEGFTPPRNVFLSTNTLYFNTNFLARAAPLAHSSRSRTLYNIYVTLWKISISKSVYGSSWILLQPWDSFTAHIPRHPMTALWYVDKFYSLPGGKLKKRVKRLLSCNTKSIWIWMLSWV